MRKAAFGFVIYFALLGSSASEPMLNIRRGFGSSEQYLLMTEIEQRRYAMGLVNGILIAPLFGAPRSEMRWFEACLTGMTDAQVAAILAKFLNENPEFWHETPNTPLISAMAKACPK